MTTRGNNLQRLALLALVAGAALGCGSKKTAEERKADSIAQCISEGIPSRAAAIANAVNITAGTGDTTGMVWIKGGKFLMGADEFPDSRPMHEVTVDGFYMDAHEVTNAEFAAFVKATNYKTVAERPLNPADYPGVPADKLVPGSAVFTPTPTRVNLDNPLQWWNYVPGANWAHPEGPQSSIKGRENYPVI
uniref:SUMF1/EgtB/PvdO family nonheme iron enzyme n=1 Tax=Dyadobacter sp. TaxID=1914288 RepID=UPI003F6E7F59